MAQFPRTEPETVALVQSVIAGLTTNTVLYPASPIPTADLEARLGAFLSAQHAAIAAQAAAKQATIAKDEALRALSDDLRTVLRYAEMTTNLDDAKLKLLGWSGRAPRSPLQAPGQVRMLEAQRQGEGTVVLTWGEPLDGGKVAAYQIQRRVRAGGSWQDAGLALTTEATLAEQPRSAELEYRVLAVNKAGMGEVSNTAMVVL